MPASRSRGRAAASAVLSVRAPCEPPKTSSTGPSAGRPNRSRACARSAGRSSSVTERRSGMPRISASGQAPGHGGGDARGEPGADPVGEARPRVGLVHDDRHPATGTEVGGERHVAAEPDDDVGVDLGEHLPHPADGRAHPTGQAQQVGAGPRGSGTGGISSSG